MEVTTSSFFLFPFWLEFSFFFSFAETLYLLCLFFLSLPLSLFLFLSIVVCNLDKYPLCRWCKCTRRDRKKNESSRRRVAVRKSREITVELLIPVLFNVSIICRRSSLADLYFALFYKSKQSTVWRRKLFNFYNLKK